MKQYLTVPAPVGLASKDANDQRVVDMFAQIINQQAQGGWTYHSMETVTFTKTSSGCLGGLIAAFGQKDNTIEVYMLIFERTV